MILRLDTATRAEFRTSWPAVALAFACMLFAFSAPGYAMPFIIKTMIAEFGWTREQAALIASAKYATGAIVSIVVGRFVDQFGVRPILIFATLCGAVALTAFLWVDSLSFYYFTGLLLGIASPGTVVALKVYLSRVYDAAQGTAIGIMFMGASVGSVIVPLAITGGIEQFGWRGGIAVMSLGMWVVALPLMIFAFPKSSSPRVESASPAEGKQVLAHLLRERRFWLLGLALFLGGLVDQGFIQHQALIFSDLGLSDDRVALAISAFGVASIISRPLIGNMFDALSNRGVGIGYLLLTLAAMLAFLISNPIIFILFVIIRAVGHSAVLLDTATLGKHTYGLANIGLLLGLFTAFVNAGFAVGPWLMGLLYGLSESYDLAFLVFALLAVLAALIAASISPEYRLKQMSKAEAG